MRVIYPFDETHVIKGRLDQPLQVQLYPNKMEKMIVRPKEVEGQRTRKFFLAGVS
jgi:hypothetical protein